MGFLSKLKNVFSSKEDNDRYLSGLEKSKNSFSNKIRKLSLTFSGVNEEFLEELMIILLEADLGIHTAQKVVDEVENRAIDRKLKNANDIEDCLVEVLSDLYTETEEKEFEFNENGPTVIMMVGVNGSGKTTTTAKLSNHFMKQGKTVCLAAADTFRAGAVDQLAMWAERLDIPCIKGKPNADPSSVLVDACRYAKEHNIDVLICDTAGRLQNKVNLMNELSKMRRVVTKEIEGAPHETWLVLDSTTGQNGLSQAEIFNEVANLTGVILTKLDGTAKGGIVIAIKDVLKLGVKFIGLGEQIEDLKPFDLESYLYSISEGFIDHEEKTEEMNEYLDWYGELLTEKQQDICDLYFKEDFSLSEISENYDISRAAVLDTIKRSKKLLEDYEKKLHLIEKYHARRKIYDKIKELNITEVNQLLEQIEDLD